MSTTPEVEARFDLVAKGRRVGVTAMSHAVIGNLLAKVLEAAEDGGVDVRVGKVGDVANNPPGVRGAKRSRGK